MSWNVRDGHGRAAIMTWGKGVGVSDAGPGPRRADKEKGRFAPALLGVRSSVRSFAVAQELEQEHEQVDEVEV